MVNRFHQICFGRNALFRSQSSSPASEEYLWSNSSAMVDQAFSAASNGRQWLLHTAASRAPSFSQQFSRKSMHSRQFLAALAATLIGAVIPSKPALARRRDDRGEYQILQARYGTATRNIDVTERLKQLARYDRRIQISNELFGEDPAVGEHKALRIYARGRNRATRVFEYQEKDFIDSSHFNGWSEGRWGDRNGRGHRWDDGISDARERVTVLAASYGSGRRSREVTDVVRSMVRGGRIDMAVENHTLGADPAPGRPKTLTVVYTVDGLRRQARVPEHGRLLLP